MVATGTIYYGKYATYPVAADAPAYLHWRAFLQAKGIYEARTGYETRIRAEVGSGDHSPLLVLRHHSTDIVTLAPVDYGGYVIVDTRQGGIGQNRAGAHSWHSPTTKDRINGGHSPSGLWGPLGRGYAVFAHKGEWYLYYPAPTDSPYRGTGDLWSCRVPFIDPIILAPNAPGGTTGGIITGADTVGAALGAGIPLPILRAAGLAEHMIRAQDPGSTTGYLVSGEPYRLGG